VTISWREESAYFLRGLLFGLTGYKTPKLKELEKKTGKQLTPRGWK
jgi:hypothetical protein